MTDVTLTSKEQPLIDALVIIQAGGLAARTLNGIAKRALEDYAMQNPNQAGPASCEGDGFKAPVAGGSLPNRSAIQPTLYVKHPDGTYSEYKPPASETRAVQSKFDLAFDILKQMQAENMDTMQSVHFGYVLRVERCTAKAAVCTCQDTAHESASSSGYTPNPTCPVHAVNGSEGT